MLVLWVIHVCYNISIWQGITKPFGFLVKKTSSLCLRKQFPLRPAAAKTIHRSQGDTLTKAVVDFSAKNLPYHMHYVALSRVTSLSGLYIRNFHETQISVCSDVATEMNRLRSTRLQISCVPQLTSTCTNFSVVFHNARSLHKNIAHLKSDHNLLKADIICICETRLCKNDQNSSISLPSHQSYRFDSNVTTNTRTPYGSIMYVSSKYPPIQSYPICCSSNSAEIMLIKLQTLSSIHTVVSVYRYQKFPFTTFLNDFVAAIKPHIFPNEILTIIGDFNCEYNRASNILENTLAQSLKISYLKQVIHEITTDYNTTIDFIYTSERTNFIAGALESYTSDHKPIFICYETTV
ncbi:ATP-dependent DNA helicase PIF1 [Holothuria leucospilota]|uniref:ATP-dependent DNA helicase PIF1 n=1 Tax=Holothuria leucospilota TaxID=206669 RepID=A0A9Q1CT58_HOLLE|nr:ATP-dependent DNA helicase PIF1 [Holothuria leucospilota]